MHTAHPGPVMHSRGHSSATAGQQQEDWQQQPPQQPPPQHQSKPPRRVFGNLTNKQQQQPHQQQEKHHQHHQQYQQQLPPRWPLAAASPLSTTPFSARPASAAPSASARPRSVSFSTKPPAITEISPRGAQASTRAYRENLRQRAQHIREARHAHEERTAVFRQQQPWTAASVASSAETHQHDAPAAASARSTVLQPPKLSAFRPRKAFDPPVTSVADDIQFPTASASQRSSLSVHRTVLAKTLAAQQTAQHQKQHQEPPVQHSRGPPRPVFTTSNSMPPRQLQPKLAPKPGSAAATAPTPVPAAAAATHQHDSAEREETVTSPEPMDLGSPRAASTPWRGKSSPLQFSASLSEVSPDASMHLRPSALRASAPIPYPQPASSPAQQKTADRRPSPAAPAGPNSSSHLSAHYPLQAPSQRRIRLPQRPVNDAAAGSHNGSGFFGKTRETNLDPLPAVVPQPAQKTFNLTDLATLMAEGDIRPEDSVLSSTIAEALSAQHHQQQHSVAATRRLGAAVFAHFVRSQQQTGSASFSHDSALLPPAGSLGGQLESTAVFAVSSATPALPVAPQADADDDMLGLTLNLSALEQQSLAVQRREHGRGMMSSHLARRRTPNESHHGDCFLTK